jgi:hypothetical protein
VILFYQSTSVVECAVVSRVVCGVERWRVTDLWLARVTVLPRGRRYITHSDISRLLQRAGGEVHVKPEHPLADRTVDTDPSQQTTRPAGTDAASSSGVDSSDFDVMALRKLIAERIVLRTKPRSTNLNNNTAVFHMFRSLDRRGMGEVTYDELIRALQSDVWSLPSSDAELQQLCSVGACCRTSFILFYLFAHVAALCAVPHLFAHVAALCVVPQALDPAGRGVITAKDFVANLAPLCSATEPSTLEIFEDSELERVT